MLLSKATPQRVRKDCPVNCNKAVFFLYVPPPRQDRKETPTTFSSECTLKKFNCDYGQNYVKIKDGPCPGGYGASLDDWRNRDKALKVLHEENIKAQNEKKIKAPIEKKMKAPIEKKTMAPIAKKNNGPNCEEDKGPK
ncbi:hypothetical protein U1Q18_051700 [Sarracenia purpurea var. burkii]